jgi:hypothetical protein
MKRVLVKNQTNKKCKNEKFFFFFIVPTRLQVVSDLPLYITDIDEKNVFLKKLWDFFASAFLLLLLE